MQESAPSVLMVFPTHFSQLFLSAGLCDPVKQGSAILIDHLNLSFLVNTFKRFEYTLIVRGNQNQQPLFAENKILPPNVCWMLFMKTSKPYYMCADSLT